jgi:hypothetical protein
VAARTAAPSIAGRRKPNPRRTRRVLTPMVNRQSLCEARRLAETDSRRAQIDRAYEGILADSGVSREVTTAWQHCFSWFVPAFAKTSSQQLISRNHVVLL